MTAFLTLAAAPALAARPDEAARWRREAAAVSIVRDDWGIAHVHGRTDADAVFGAVYAQAEDDFNRVETNYINALGRMAEVEGASAIWQDLRMKLFVQPAGLQSKYATSPVWLKALMDAWADGLNYYLLTHPAVKPRLITRFEPWMALSFSEGSIGGDVERVSLDQLAAFYGDAARPALADADAAAGSVKASSGSNGFAIAPSNTRGGHALLLINPHTSLFFRSELQMTSDEGLNAYGASTWGQFFIYQGFNEHAGWMHTSSGVDSVDEFSETIVRRDGRLFYRYGSEERPVTVTSITVPYRSKDGAPASRSFTTYATHHGPIVRQAHGRWIAIALMNKPIEALSQSFLRTKAHDYAAYLKVAELKANSSNNTLFADDRGTIAYLHPQFIPRRDDRFDYTRPVDGSDPTTDWHGLHALNEAPHVVNPPNGWVFNVNDWPYSAAGANSPRREDYPRYMDTAGENQRTPHAIRVLEGRRDFTLESLNAAAHDSFLPAFAGLVPELVAAWDAAADTDPLKAKLKLQIALLRAWDHRYSAASVETSLAVLWGETLWSAAPAPGVRKEKSAFAYILHATTPPQKLQALATASDRLATDFGSWRTPWGELNRFQRTTGDIVQPFDDAKPSLPVAYASGQWGSLAAFEASPYAGSKRHYGTSGNSFVAVVEFGPKVRALAVSAGGESGDPASPHFSDQAGLYARGELRPVYFHSEDLARHTVRRYRPGE